MDTTTGSHLPPTPGLRRSPARIGGVVASTLLLQVFLAVLCAAVFSRFLAGSAGGWGDLIGTVVGIHAGFWAGLVAALFGFGRRAGRPWWMLLLAAVVAPPVQFLIVGTLVNFGMPFSIVAAVLLAVSCSLVLTVSHRR